MKNLLYILALLPSLVWAQATANLWIDTNGGTCTRQATAAVYADAAACSSMDAAIGAASNGDLVRMKAGVYGTQTINQTKGSPGVTLIAEEGTSSSGGLDTNGAWYEIQNFSANSWDIETFGTNNITCRRCTFASTSAYIVNWSPDTTGVGPGVSMDTIRWIGGRMGGTRAINNQACSFCIYPSSDTGGSGDSATNLLIEGVLFNDNIDTAAGPPDFNHYEVIRVDGNVNGLSLISNTFQDNETSTAQIFFSTSRGVKPQNLLFRNNFFGSDPIAFTIIQMNFQNQDDCSDWTFEYNTFKKTPIIDATSGGCDATFTNIVWTGNLMPRGSCQGNTFNYNLGFGSSGSACSGAGNTVDTEANVDFEADGFHIGSSSSAIDAGAPSGASCIADDHDGSSRPRGSNCDAGAHEQGAPPAPADFDLSGMWEGFLRFLSGLFSSAESFALMG